MPRLHFARPQTDPPASAELFRGIQTDLPASVPAGLRHRVKPNTKQTFHGTLVGRGGGAVMMVRANEVTVDGQFGDRQYGDRGV